MCFRTKALKGTLAEQGPESGVNIDVHTKRKSVTTSLNPGNPFSPSLAGIDPEPRISSGVDTFSTRLPLNGLKIQETTIVISTNSSKNCCCAKSFTSTALQQRGSCTCLPWPGETVAPHVPTDLRMLRAPLTQPMDSQVLGFLLIPDHPLEFANYHSLNEQNSLRFTGQSTKNWAHFLNAGQPQFSGYFTKGVNYHAGWHQIDDAMICLDPSHLKAFTPWPGRWSWWKHSDHPSPR